MEIPENLMYTETHEWMKQLRDGRVAIGITQYAADSLGEMVYLTLPELEQGLLAGEAFAEIESASAQCEVISPVDGIVSEINEVLLDEPELINDMPYDSWLVKVDEVTDGVDLMTAEEYEEYLKTL